MPESIIRTAHSRGANLKFFTTFFVEPSDEMAILNACHQIRKERLFLLATIKPVIQVVRQPLCGKSLKALDDA